MSEKAKTHGTVNVIELKKCYHGSISVQCYVQYVAISNAHLLYK